MNSAVHGLIEMFSKNTPIITFIRFDGEYENQYSTVIFSQNGVEYSSSVKKVKYYIKKSDYQYERVKTKIDLPYIHRVTKDYCVNNNASLISYGEFNARDTIVTTRCENGHIVERKFKSIDMNRNCSKCVGPDSLSYDEIRHNVNSRTDELNYTFNGFKEINGARSVLDLTCSRGHSYEPLYYNFINSKYKCGSCAMYDKSSYKCEEILSYLTSQGLDVLCEYTFSDCKNKNVLPFDFYIPSLNLCIEYDGEQHFYPIEHWGGMIALEKQKKNDTLKNVYCKLNGIHLIRIKYNIENYIDVISEFIKGIKNE